MFVERNCGKRQWLFRVIFISLPTSLHMQKFGEFVKSNPNSSCELYSSGIRAVSLEQTLGYRA